MLRTSGLGIGAGTCQRALVDLFRALGLESDAHGLDQSQGSGVGPVRPLRRVLI
jgi:hypothetical protein